MKSLLFLLLCAGIVACVYGNTIPPGEAENFCPPPKNIAPCTCFKAPNTKRIVAHCSNFTNSHEIKAIFDRNPNWKLQDVWISNSVMPYLPAKMLEKAHFQYLNVSSTTLDTLFDFTPKKTPELDVFMFNVKIMRGFQWSNIGNSSLLAFKAVNMTLRNLGKDFKEHMPKGVKKLWFDNTGIASIRNDAFSNLEKLQVLEIRRGSLKKLSRDWFPRPFNVFVLDFSYQKIAALPEDMFVDLPNLGIFLFSGNLLTTLSEAVFTKHNIIYTFDGNPINCNCDIKWIVGKLSPPNLYGECFEPESFKGTALRDLNEENLGYCF